MSDHESTGPTGELERLIEILGRQAEASRRTADLIQSSAVPLLERIALALERAAGSARPAVDGLRRAIEGQDWDRVEAIARDHPDDPQVVAASENLRQRIEAARQANDPDAAMASRDELARLLHGEPIQEVDRSLVKWLIGLIHKRLRTGTIRPDVVGLAGRVADRFGGTAEGASLRAALPTLRRSAGLCPKCGEPYTGLADACPKCLAPTADEPAPDPSRPIADADPVPEDDPEAGLVGEPLDLNDERFWEAP